jgi:hypothetical protein
MRQLLKQRRLMLAIALPALVLACGGSNEPDVSPIAGNYVATLFTTTGGSGQRNELAAGSTFTLSLAADGTTSGHLHIAASGSNPVFDADMAGTWTAANNIVNIDQPADTFVRDMPFTWGPDAQGIYSLTGDRVFSGTRIQVMLVLAN